MQAMLGDISAMRTVLVAELSDDTRRLSKLEMATDDGGVYGSVADH